MNYQEAIYPEGGSCRPCRVPGSCVEKVILFFALLFVLTAGLILGVLFSSVLLPALYAIIAFAAATAASIVALLIYRRCECRRQRGD